MDAWTNTLRRFKAPPGSPDVILHFGIWDDYDVCVTGTSCVYSCDCYALDIRVEFPPSEQTPDVDASRSPRRLSGNISQWSAIRKRALPVRPDAYGWSFLSVPFFKYTDTGCVQLTRSKLRSSRSIEHRHQGRVLVLYRVATKARNLRENMERIERALCFRKTQPSVKSPLCRGRAHSNYDGLVMTRSLARSRWVHEALPLEKDRDPRSKNMPAKSSCVLAHHVE